MKINARITLVIFCFLVILSGTILIAANQIISSDYNSLEQVRARDEMENVLSLINTDLIGRERVITDWAVWNDTYFYLENPEENGKYIIDNVYADSLATLDVNYFILFGKDGHIVYASYYNEKTGQTEPVPQSTLDDLSKAKYLLNPDDLSVSSGFLITDDGPVLVVLQKVRQYLNSGPTNGVMLMGKKFDEGEVARLREYMSGSLAVLTPASPDLPPAVIARFGYGNDATGDILVNFNDGSGVESYAALSDLQGKTGLILRIQEPETYLTLARETFLKIFILVLVLTAFFGLIIYFIIREHLDRLEKMDTFVSEIRRQGDLSRRITLSGDDELSAIGDQMNRMLETLERSQNDLAEAHKAVIEVNKKLNLMTSVTRHDIINRLNAIIGYLGLVEESKDAVETALLISKVNESAESIQKSITFTTNYQKLGTKEPIWYDLEDILPYTAVPTHIQFQSPPETIQVYADALVEQVFGNLLDNTLRHGGEAVAKIRVTATRAGDDLVITWEDDGVGIPASEKEKIFKRGYGRNTGLGLFFIREILSITGITIRETGEPGKGARFEITVSKGRFRIL